MARKVKRLDDYISSTEAAARLSIKCGRTIDPDYIRRLKNVKTHRANGKCILYCADDIEKCTIRPRVLKKLSQE